MSKILNLSVALSLSLALLSGCTPDDGKVQMTEIDRDKTAVEAVTSYTDENIPDENLYSVKHGKDTDTYTNMVDGYKITVPSGMKPDTSLAHIRFKLSGPNESIEIFKERFSSFSECNHYTWYSNIFKEDTVNHNVTMDSEFSLKNNTVRVLAWDRVSFGPDDRNHYVNIDVINNTDVYTITIKSCNEIDYWYDIAESFVVTMPTVSAASHPFPSTPNPGKSKETAEFMERIFGEDSGLNWGLYVPSALDAGMTDYELIEDQIGAKLDLFLTYFGVSENYDSNFICTNLNNAWASGKVVELTMQTMLDGSAGSVYDILLGKHDDFIDSLIADIKNFGHPVLMRLFNEMNGDWCNYSAYHTSRDPDVYIRLYHYIVDKFNAAGVDNVIWIWNPNERSYPNFLWNCEELYYPGNNYVDVVGLTGYNNGTYYESVGEKWRTFDEIYSAIYPKALVLYNKPLMITEFSCSSIGGDKVVWVRDMFESLPNYPMIKAAVWWSGCDYDPENGNISRPYFINETEGVIDLFRENLAKNK